jgi:hypothetical protein
MLDARALVAIDDHWKSLDRHSDPHCHTWQTGRHIDTLARDGPERPRETPRKESPWCQMQT